MIVIPEVQPEVIEKDEEIALLKKIIQEKNNQISQMSLSMLTKDKQVASQQKRIRILRRKLVNERSSKLNKNFIQTSKQREDYVSLNKSNCVIEKM